MKLFRTNMVLFVSLPLFVAMLSVSYMILIYSRSSLIVNAINIGFDGIILVYYFTNFIYKVRADQEWIIFYNAFGQHKMRRAELGFVVNSKIMTKFVCKQRNFFVFTTKEGSLVLKSMFKDMIKEDMDE